MHEYYNTYKKCTLLKTEALRFLDGIKTRFNMHHLREACLQLGRVFRQKQKKSG